MDKPKNSRDELRKLHPGLTEEELEQVEDRLDRYLELAIRISERLTQEAKQSDEPTATQDS